MFKNIDSDFYECLDHLEGIVGMQALENRWFAYLTDMYIMDNGAEWIMQDFTNLISEYRELGI